MLKNVAVSPPIIFQTRTGGEEKACKIPYSNQYVPNPPLARGPPEGVPARWRLFFYSDAKARTVETRRAAYARTPPSIGPCPENMLAPLLRLAPAPRICSLPSPLRRAAPRR
eukprot:1180677-Prorocentrum_minimum.AAC.2